MNNTNIKNITLMNRGKVKGVILLFIFLISNPSNACFFEAEKYRECVYTDGYDESSKKCKKLLIEDYSNYLYQPLNQHLRGIEKNKSCEYILESFKWAYDQLSHVGEKKVYRGITRVYRTLDIIQEGECILERGYLSTSTSRKVVEKFTPKEEPIVLEISGISGRKFGLFTGRFFEFEVLFAPGTILKLNKIRNDKPWVKNGLSEKVYEFIEVLDHSSCVDLH